MDIDDSSMLPRYANRPNFWTRIKLDVKTRELGDMCSIKPTANNTVSITNYSPTFAEAARPASFWEALVQWGNTSMWDNMKMTGDVSWLEEMIAAGTCITVTD